MSQFKTQEEPPVVVQRKGPMMKVILNRPRVLNSLNLEMIRLIDKVLDETEADKSCQFILLCGAGERGFCAGGDPAEKDQNDDKDDKPMPYAKRTHKKRFLLVRTKSAPPRIVY